MPRARQTMAITEKAGLRRQPRRRPETDGTHGRRQNARHPLRQRPAYLPGARVSQVDRGITAGAVFGSQALADGWRVGRWSVNCCDSIGHHAPPRRSGEHAIGIPRQGHVAIVAPQGDDRRPIILAKRACSRSNRITASTSPLSLRPYRSCLSHDASFS